MKIWTWALALALLPVPTFADAAEHGPAALALVKPTSSCAALMDVDLTDIGGPGSTVTAASEGSDGTAPTCIIEGNLAPTIGFKRPCPAKAGTSGICRWAGVACVAAFR